MMIRSSRFIRRQFFTNEGPSRQALNTSGFEYDLVVIGGGSGGMAAAKKASSLGAKVRKNAYVATRNSNHEHESQTGSQF